ncbi:MAG: YraN family protein [Treponema sp.]|nr:YraN family protein [Treponema sp.]MBQ7619390.1 YraN family protein [Treponema sp.]MBQ9627205.1 YraN family protein [Treponema sp.]
MRNSGNTRPTGLDGERRAADFYEKNGYQIVGRNFRTRFGEIDLIAQKGETLVFSEVKALPGGNSEILAEELGQRKRRKIIETAKYFLKNHRQYSNKLIRFDAVVIDMPGFESVHLIENAFSEN